MCNKNKIVSRKQQRYDKTALLIRLQTLQKTGPNGKPKNISRFSCRFRFIADVSTLVRPKTIVFGKTYVLRMFFSTREISEMGGPTGVKFCTMVSTRQNFIMPVQNFVGRTQKKFWGRKTCKIWPDFGRLWSSAANISETLSLIHIWRCRRRG